jgi:hypothetical protein
MALLNGVELPALEDGCANKKLLVRPRFVSFPRYTPTSILASPDKTGRKDAHLSGCVQIAADERRRMSV